MGWEKTHNVGQCVRPLLGALFMKAGAIWKCDDCGTRWEVTKTIAADGSTRTGWRKL